MDVLWTYLKGMVIIVNKFAKITMIVKHMIKTILSHKISTYNISSNKT